MEIDLSPKLAKKVYGGDGGSYFAWSPSELPMLREGNIGAAKLALEKNGFALHSSLHVVSEPRLHVLEPKDWAKSTQPLHASSIPTTTSKSPSILDVQKIRVRLCAQPP
ncbi:11S globulin seed storage protein 2-like [Prunus yedoensis var. nudiflora]|uniref:11S globulin seed storage protein 2-like n=1 Tax=Prunus yedoensis var. nudiflora TaxID=2094558 RepID=A0A314Y713_PRUYE|nr:11S globulin seed storage protein 2-like [Prunus yedoensis var. nudiflora]